MDEKKERYIEALREAADILGESPTKSQYEELGLTPAQSTIQRVMGAGMKRRRQLDWKRTNKVNTAGQKYNLSQTG